MSDTMRRNSAVALILIPYILIIAIVLQEGSGDPLYTLLQLCGLCGFLSLSGAVILNINKPVLQKILGEPFLRIHHFFAISGLVLITLHPVLFILLTSDMAVLIPSFSSIYLFLANGGRVAIILLYLVFLAGLLKGVLGSRWKIIHRLTYPALLLAFMHASLIGSTLGHPVIRMVFILLIVLILGTGLIKVMRRRR